jgi:ABC-type sugar transport system ATPase subunit
MAQIIMDHVEKAYAGGIKAINDLSLDIADGEFMVFVGPSGCGRSTALRSIAGLEEITGGTITIGDRLGVTTVYVTHDQVEAMTLGNRVAVLREGRLQQVDTPQALFESPVNLFVAGFIGSPAMNFVTAELVRDGGAAVTFAGYKLPVPAEVLEAKPGLADYFGKNVILGIRPSDFEDAAVADRQSGTMRVTAGVTEELEGEPGQARGAARAGRRHALPAVLRPGQRPVHRPPASHGGAGGLTRLGGGHRPGQLRPGRHPGGQGRSIAPTVGNCRDAAESGGTLRARSGRA